MTDTNVEYGDTVANTGLPNPAPAAEPQTKNIVVSVSGSSFNYDLNGPWTIYEAVGALDLVITDLKANNIVGKPLVSIAEGIGAITSLLKNAPQSQVQSSTPLLEALRGAIDEVISKSSQ